MTMIQIRARLAAAHDYIDALERDGHWVREGEE